MDTIASLLNLLDDKETVLNEFRLSLCFEFLAAKLFYTIRPGYWYDGAVELRYRRRKERQLIFTGQMWVARGPDRQWQEDFEARITDMRSTRQGIRLKMRIGDFTAEGEIGELERPPP